MGTRVKGRKTIELTPKKNTVEGGNAFVSPENVSFDEV
jgi:hypothetical protein